MGNMALCNFLVLKIINQISPILGIALLKVLPFYGKALNGRRMAPFIGSLKIVSSFPYILLIGSAVISQAMHRKLPIGKLSRDSKVLYANPSCFGFFTMIG